MPVKKWVGALALGATLAGGGAAGALLGVPGVSGAATSVEDRPAVADHGPDRGFGRFDHGPGRGFGRFDLGVAAEALGMSEDELRTALAEDDTSIADVAEAEGVDVQTVIDALVADAGARIDEAVADGELASDRAEEIKAELPDRVTEMVNNEFRGRGPKGERGFGHGRGHGHGVRGIDLGVAAEALGMTEDELGSALEDGTTLADVAADRDVDVQTVIDALVEAATEDIEEHITDAVNGE